MKISQAAKVIGDGVIELLGGTSPIKPYHAFLQKAAKYGLNMHDDAQVQTQYNQVRQYLTKKLGHKEILWHEKARDIMQGKNERAKTCMIRASINTARKILPIADVKILAAGDDSFK